MKANSAESSQVQRRVTKQEAATLPKARGKSSKATVQPIAVAQKSKRDDNPGHGDPYQLQGLGRVVAILDLLGTSDGSLSLAEICHRMELRKSTAHRALMALERTGLIERAPGSGYRLGLKLYDMGNRAVEQIDLRARVHPHLRKLALRVGETVHLGVLHKARVVYIDKVEPINRRVCISSRTGTSNPCYSTSLGKAILAFLPPEETVQIIRSIKFTAFTSKTLTTQEEFLNALERVRRRGYAIDDEEMEIGTRCVGAPIFDSGQRPIAAVSVSGSALRFEAHCIPSIADHVIRCSMEISSALVSR